MAILIHLGPARLIPEQLDWNITTGQVVEVTQGQSVNLAALLTNTTGIPAQITHVAAPNALPAGTQLSTAGVWSADIAAPSVTSTGHQLLADTEPGGFQSFATRRSAPGVVRVFDWDSPSQLGAGPNGHGYAFNFGWYGGVDEPLGSNALDHPVIDNTVFCGASGGSLRVRMDDTHAGGLWVTNFAQDIFTENAANPRFNEGDEFFIQWRQRFNPAMLSINEFLQNVPSGGGAGGNQQVGGWKTSIVAMGDHAYTTAGVMQSCQWGGFEIQSIPQGVPPAHSDEIFPQFLHGCPNTGQVNLVVSHPQEHTLFQNMMPTPFCSYNNTSQGQIGALSGGNCFAFHPNEWMTMQYGITLGTRIDANYVNARFRFWMAREGQPQVLVHDQTSATMNPARWQLREKTNPTQPQWYGKFWISTRYTIGVLGTGFVNGYPNKRLAIADGEVWDTHYDELIISRNFIADPLDAAPPPPPDGTVWIAGNGPTWEDGATPGAPTWTALQGVVNNINATTGGWGQLAGTALAPVLLTRGRADAIQAAREPPAVAGSSIWDVQGPLSVLKVWTSASWTGKSFLVGPGGGHGAYNGVEVYRIRLTDPPLAVMMYEPPAVCRVAVEPESDPGQINTVSDWGPSVITTPPQPGGLSALHHYDAIKWMPHMKKVVYAEFGGWDGIWTFDPDNAPTPKSAWKCVSFQSPQQNPDPFRFGYPSIVMMTDDELYIANNLASQGAPVVVNLTTGLRRSLAAYPTDPFRLIQSGLAYMYMCRSSTALTSKVYFTDGASGQPTFNVRSYDPSTGTFSTRDSGNAFPSWWPITGDAYRTIALAEGSFGTRIVGYAGNPHNFGDVGSSWKVFCYNPATNTMLDYTLVQASNPGLYNSDGSLGGRWQYVPQVKAFVALRGYNEDVWVFRPPASWGIV